MSEITWKQACEGVIDEFLLGCLEGTQTLHRGFFLVATSKATAEHRGALLRAQVGALRLATGTLGSFLRSHLSEAGVKDNKLLEKAIHDSWQAADKVASLSWDGRIVGNLRGWHSGRFLGTWRRYVTKLLEGIRKALKVETLPKVMAAVNSQPSGHADQMQKTLREGPLPLWTRSMARRKVERFLAAFHPNLLFLPNVIAGVLPNAGMKLPGRLRRPGRGGILPDNGSLGWIQLPDGKWVQVPAHRCKWVKRPNGKWVQVLHD